MPYRSDSHRKFCLKCHIIFVCKYKKSLFLEQGVSDFMKADQKRLLEKPLKTEGSDSSPKLKTSECSRLQLDKKMQDRSNGATSLDDFMHGLFKITQSESRPFEREEF